MKTFKETVKSVYSKWAMALVYSLFLLFILFSFPASAQRDRHGGDRNGNARENNSRQNTVREQPQRVQRSETRRNDAAFERSNPSRDITRYQNHYPVNTDRNIQRERNDAPRIINHDANREFRNNPVNQGRDLARERNVNANSYRREGNINNGGRPRDIERHESYSRERPGERPEYRYDRRPVYDRFEPCWRYNYLPYRNSFYYSLPSNYFSINFGGFGYRYWDGVFYRPFNNLFTVCAPPIGIYIDILPVGYRRIYVRNYPYYYYNGAYYDQHGSGYTVVSPPVGAIVESLPGGYETINIDGETYYTVDGAQYKPVLQENGEIWYEVVRAN